MVQTFAGKLVKPDRDGTDVDEEEISDADNGKDVEEVRVSVISSTPTAKDKRSPKETPLSSKKVGVKGRRNERRKRQKAIKKKALRIMTRTNQIMERTDTISVFKAKCSTSQSSLDSVNRAFGILKRKYQTLKGLMSQSKSNLVKETRQDQLSVVKDSNNKDIVLGQGRFGVCKLMSLSVSGESAKVAVKHHTKLTAKEAFVDEACLLSGISHEAFPFVFGVVFGELHNLLVSEVCGITEGIEHKFIYHL